VKRFVGLVAELRPRHLSIVGGEPLVRFRELSEILPRMTELGVEVQLVTSAVRQIPPEWARFDNLHLSVSIDGLPAEHDVRRAPATYKRIVQNITGHRVVVHCTVTRPMCRPGYLEEFCAFWSARDEVRKIWFSLYTPQDGEVSAERLGPDDRAFVLGLAPALRARFPKLELPDSVVDGYTRPPGSPSECVFAQITNCFSADLDSRIGPCQFGGKPICSECGCMAAAGMTAISRKKLGFVPLGAIFAASRKIGSRIAVPEQPEEQRQAA
jgi:hypothetical protein